MSPSPQDRGFSVSWILVSYFAICGGIVLAVAVFLATGGNSGLDPRVAGYVTCGVGGLVGGFFAGRASRHFSIVEPAVAGALVIGSVYALVKWTAIGPWAFTFAAEAIVRESLVLGGLAFGGGLSGALLGELSWTGTPSANPIRWFGMTVFLTAGALLVSAIGASVAFADQTLRDPEALRQILTEGTVRVTEDEVVRVVLAALAATGFLGGAVAQLAAPARILSAATLGVLVTVGGGIAGLLAWGGELREETVRGALLLGGGAAFLAFVGALAVWLVRRAVGR